MPRIKAVSMVEIQDDLTGETMTLPETEISEITVTLPGSKEPQTLTLAPATATAFAGMLANPTTEHRKAFAALFGPAPAASPAPARKRAKGKASGDADRNSAIREWADQPANRKALGIAADQVIIGARGRIPAAWATAYDAAHGSPAAASDPADAARASAEHNGLTGQAASPAESPAASPAKPARGKAASKAPAAA